MPFPRMTTRRWEFAVAAVVIGASVQLLMPVISQ